MKVLILAAGIGSRLGLGTPKVLVKIGGKSILEHHVNSLMPLGIEPADVTVVTGFMSDEVASACRSLGLNTLENPNWRYPGTYSSFAVFPRSEEPLLILHGDLVWEAGLAESIIRKQSRSVVVPVDPRTRLDGEAMKVEVRSNRILHMSKKLPFSRSAGESMGMFLLNDHRIIRRCSSGLIDNPEASFDDAINTVAGLLTVEAVITDEFTWEEIDTPSDLIRAERKFS